MSKRIVLTGYTVTPLLGVLDTDTDEVRSVPFQPMQIAPGGLTQFETTEWPAQLAEMRKEFAAEISRQDAARRDVDALAAVAAKPPRAARRARPTKKAKKRAPARKK